jgi:hypothetical protein
VAAILLTRAVPSRRAASPSGWNRTVKVSNLVGTLALIPTLGFAGVARPGPGLGIAQGLADGYIAVLFGGILLFIQRPRSKRDSGS